MLTLPCYHELVIPRSWDSLGCPNHRNLFCNCIRKTKKGVPMTLCPANRNGGSLPDTPMILTPCPYDPITGGSLPDTPMILTPCPCDPIKGGSLPDTRDGVQRPHRTSLTNYKLTNYYIINSSYFATDNTAY